MSLLSRWKLDEVGGTTAFDDVGSNNGTAANTIVSDGRGILFNATTDVVAVPPDAAINNIFAGGGTIAWWQRSDGRGGGNNGRVFSKTWIAVGMITDTSHMVFEQGFTGGGDVDGTWSFPMAPGIYEHIAIVYDNALTTNDPVVYVNGVSVAVTETATPAGTANDDSAVALNLGNNSAMIRGWDGSISDLRMYGRLLTQQEVTAIFQSTIPGQRRGYRRNRYMIDILR